MHVHSYYMHTNYGSIVKGYIQRVARADSGHYVHIYQ